MTVTEEDELMRVLKTKSEALFSLRIDDVCLVIKDNFGCYYLNHRAAF